MTSSRASLRRIGQLSSQLARPSVSAAAVSGTSTGTAGLQNSYYTTIPPPVAQPLDAAALRATMMARPEQLTHDVMSPMPTHLLNLALSDYLPAAALPPPGLILSHRPEDAPPLPEAYHLVHFPLQLAVSELIPDGTDPFPIPGAPFERRLWAGGRIAWHRGAVLRARGQAAVCRETIEDVRVKGRAGDEKIFVDVTRRYGDRGFAPGGEAFTETRTLVFQRERSAEEAREAAAAAAATKDTAPRVLRAPHPPSFRHTLTPTPALLFQYSALTYNAHQIHLNPQYCREVEGHRNLLVHGPLSLTLMLCVLRSQLDASRDRIRSIDYRNLAPLYVGEPLTVCVRPMTSTTGESKDGERKWDVWVENNDGGLSVRGTVVVGPA